MDQAVEHQGVAGLQRDGDALIGEHMVRPYRAKIDVLVRDVRRRAGEVGAGDHLHAAVFAGGGIQRDPDAKHQPRIAAAEIGGILVPRLLAADSRRFQQCHFLHQQASASHDAIQPVVQLRRHRRTHQRRVGIGEVAEFADQIDTRRRRGLGRIDAGFHRGERLVAVPFLGDAGLLGEARERSEARGDVIGGQQPPDHHISATAVVRDVVKVHDRFLSAQAEAIPRGTRFAERGARLVDSTPHRAPAELSRPRLRVMSSGKIDRDLRRDYLPVLTQGRKLLVAFRVACRDPGRRRSGSAGRGVIEFVAIVFTVCNAHCRTAA